MKRVILLSLIVLTLVLTACGSQTVYLCPDGTIGGSQMITSEKVVYVCPDGTKTLNYASCVFTAKISIQQSDAEKKALNFANGHLMANGWQSTLVNVNVVEGDWLAQVVVSKFDEDSFETVIRVDGDTGFASCDKNCDYLN